MSRGGQFNSLARRGGDRCSSEHVSPSKLAFCRGSHVNPLRSSGRPRELPDEFTRALERVRIRRCYPTPAANEAMRVGLSARAVNRAVLFVNIIYSWREKRPRARALARAPAFEGRRVASADGSRGRTGKKIDERRGVGTGNGERSSGGREDGRADGRTYVRTDGPSPCRPPPPPPPLPLLLLLLLLRIEPHATPRPPEIT